ncbi:hypothetical protein MMC22_005776 [Lobaria immixta]|nr:hypothetical protein [Lobaria immixta]
MSFRGFGSSSLGGTGDDGSGERACESPVDQYGEELRATISDIISDSQDTEVQEILPKFFHIIQDDQRPSTEEVINKAAQLVELSGGNISPHEAILRIARAAFDYPAAADAYLAESGDGSLSISSLQSGSEIDEDPKVEAPGEGNHLVSGETEEGLESSSTENNIIDVFRQNLAANPGIDRSVAKRGHPDQSKLTITMRQPDGRPDKVHVYRRAVDFRKPVRSLNRWRSQIFRRHFGGSRPYRQRFHELEKEWLFQEHVDFEHQRLAQGKLIDYSAMRWGEITERFNRRFEGQYLPNVRNPRPSRTRLALRSGRSRVKKITDYTGLPFTMQSRRGGLNSELMKPVNKLESEEEHKSSDEGDDEDSDEGEEDSRGTRRGDSPPGKDPWRKDEDEEEQGGGGLSRPICTSEIGV